MGTGGNMGVGGGQEFSKYQNYGMNQEAVGRQKGTFVAQYSDKQDEHGRIMDAFGYSQGDLYGTYDGTAVSGNNNGVLDSGELKNYQSTLAAKGNSNPESLDLMFDVTDLDNNGANDLSERTALYLLQDSASSLLDPDVVLVKGQGMVEVSDLQQKMINDYLGNNNMGTNPEGTPGPDGKFSQKDVLTLAYHLKNNPDKVKALLQDIHDKQVKPLEDEFRSTYRQDLATQQE